MEKNKRRKSGKESAAPGRPKGVPNRTTTVLKDAILQAATEAGGGEGLVGYLKTLAVDSPQAFASLLGKVLPLQVVGDEDKPLTVTHVILRAADDQRDA